ncbi:MAG: Bd3614 family nucleic acid deaminase [Myxococcota bacterium]
MAFVRGDTFALALAVWEAYPGRAHEVLRRRIRRTSPLTELDRAAAAVVGKRVSEVPPQVGPPPALVDLGAAWARGQQRAVASAFDPGPRLGSDRAWVEGAVPSPAALRRAQRDRPVAAILLGPGGAVSWAARNAGGHNRALHAEACVVLGVGRIPAGSTLLVSLEPCRMCAALVVAAADGPVDVGFATPDPGPLARDTALGARGWLRQL